MYKHIIKRFIDFLVALIALIVLTPFLIMVSIWLHFANEGAGIIFRQKRPGKDSVIFDVLKFKTMTDEKDEKGNLLPIEKRLTRVGKLVRSVSIDELPQLINVLKGEMSIVGPRPLLVQYLPLYSKLQARRHEVRPGITGWAQVNGRNAISWQEKFEFDHWYVEHLSMWLDIKIILLTIKKVIKREGITFESTSTTHFFEGNN